MEELKPEELRVLLKSAAVTTAEAGISLPELWRVWWNEHGMPLIEEGGVNDIKR